MSLERTEAAFRRASAAIDEAWQLARDAFRMEVPRRIDTLSTSLAEPFAFQVEMTLSNARMAIQSSGDREALIAVARASCAMGLINETALARLVKEFGG